MLTTSDIKPSNFLLDKSGHLKLCDFATCAPFSTFSVPGFSAPQRCVLSYFTQRPAGTCDYIAPEVLQCEERRIVNECPSPLSASGSTRDASCIAPDTFAPGGYGPAVDWWSVGVVLYEMTFGLLPFWAPQPAEVYQRIAHHQVYFAMNSETKCSDELRNLIAALVCAENARLGRVRTQDVQRHKMFENVPWDRPWTCTWLYARRR